MSDYSTKENKHEDLLQWENGVGKRRTDYSLRWRTKTFESENYCNAIKLEVPNYSDYCTIIHKSQKSRVKDHKNL